MALRAFLLVPIVALLCFATIARNHVWKTPLALWSDVNDKSPGKIRPYINLAAVYIDEQQMNEALDVLFRATDAFKDKIYSGDIYFIGAALEIYLNFGVIYGAKGDLNKAQEFVEKAYETNPSSPRANYALGYLYLEKGDKKKAEQFLKRAIELQEEPKAYFLYADLLEKAGKEKEALEFLKRAVWIEPENAFVRNRLGVLLKNAGDRAAAEAQWNAALRLSRGFAEPYVNLGSLFYEKGQVKKAYSYYLKAIENDPKSYEAYVGAGNAADELGNFPVAIEHYRKAVKLEPDRPEAHVNLGIAFERAGRKSEAASSYRKALRLNPKDGQARDGLRRVGG